MSHKSESSTRLSLVCEPPAADIDLSGLHLQTSDVCLIALPVDQIEYTDRLLEAISGFGSRLPSEAVLCIWCGPEFAASLLARLGTSLRFQLWNAVKLTPGSVPDHPGQLPRRHGSLLVLSRYQHSLRHAKTRVAYTFCPACGKTTKDYGGKKHTYHEYGTLLSDVWRDIEVDPAGDLAPLTDRLRDFFGIEPHRTLHFYDLRTRSAPTRRRSSCQTEQAARIVEPKPDPLQLPAAKPAVKLINADCIESLRKIPDNSIDYCFADPPYNVSKTYDSWNDGLEISEYFRWCDAWLTELCRVLKPGRTLSVINIPIYTARHFAHLRTLTHFQSWIAWDGLSLPVRLVMPAHYGIVSFSKGEPRPLPGLSSPVRAETRDEDALRPLPEFYCVRQSCVLTHARKRSLAVPPITDLWHDIHRLKHNSRRVDHPCQLPPALMRRLFALFTKPGETVLDCFNGAGTSTLTALQMGRSAIGIELSTEYHVLATSRHEALAAGIDPFAGNGQTPKAKNSRVERLPKRTYAVPKKTLQLEVREIARRLGRLPTREDVCRLSKHPIAYFDEYFVSWGEVCASARHTGMSEHPNRTEGADSPAATLFG